MKREKWDCKIKSGGEYDRENSVEINYTVNGFQWNSFVLDKEEAWDLALDLITFLRKKENEEKTL